MFFNFVNISLSILGMLIVWYVLFSLFTDKSPASIGRKLALLVIVLWPVIASSTYQIYSIISRVIFNLTANGEVQLRYSPLNAKSKGRGYCDQLTLQSGQPIEIFTVAGDGAYCGAFFEYDVNKGLMIPYKNLPNNKALYWTSPDQKIIGPRVDTNSI